MNLLSLAGMGRSVRSAARGVPAQLIEIVRNEPIDVKDKLEAVMNDVTTIKPKTRTFSNEISDDILETAAFSGNGRVANFHPPDVHRSVFCPGP